MPEESEMQDAFHAVFDMKNELAGYESFVRDRYYPRHDQMPWLFREAGFTAVEDVRTCHFRQSTLKRRDSELGGSDSKLARLNEYARHRITHELGRRMAMDDRGNDILLTVPNRIIRGRKPGTQVRGAAQCPP